MVETPRASPHGEGAGHAEIVATPGRGAGGLVSATPSPGHTCQGPGWCVSGPTRGREPGTRETPPRDPRGRARGVLSSAAERSMPVWNKHRPTTSRSIPSKDSTLCPCSHPGVPHGLQSSDLGQEHPDHEVAQGANEQGSAGDKPGQGRSTRVCAFGICTVMAGKASEARTHTLSFLQFPTPFPCLLPSFAFPTHPEAKGLRCRSRAQARRQDVQAAF